MDSEASSLVRGRTNDGTRAAPGHHDRLATQLGIIALLDRSVERIHVYMEDLSNHPLMISLESGTF
jgi:hypothetical protein